MGAVAHHATGAAALNRFRVDHARGARPPRGGRAPLLPHPKLKVNALTPGL
jgi:hypothetical protein